MHVINLWGAPSSGKSTTAAGLFFLMKINKFKVELVTEYAKDLSWEFSHYQRVLGIDLKNKKEDLQDVEETLPALQREQTQIFAEQNHRLLRLHGEVDYAITDSPLPLAVFYMPKNYFKEFPSVVFEQFHKYENTNFFLHRKGEFENFGRIHTEKQSVFLSEKLREFLKTNQINFNEIDATPNTPNEIFERIFPKPLQMKIPNAEHVAGFEVVEKDTGNKSK